MFSSIGWSEMMILLVAALVILGPERLPGAVRWTTGALRQARDYASGATTQLKQELGPEFDDLRKPLAELNELRGMSPRAVVTKHLLGGDDSVLRDLEKAVPDKQQLFGTNSGMPATPAPQKSLERNERPPVDYDAT
ncbi:Sec-independent protein translocase protein TatB [Nocardia sp. NPDC058666]|uniref:Sec-independent protein translocase protein TatB n=1 Tax=unclassified Nocardia TaxID=2637762 RepID=UPI0036578F13